MNLPAEPLNTLGVTLLIKMRRRRLFARAFLFVALLAVAASNCFSQRLPSAPRLRTGQILFYRIDFSSSRDLKTESRFTTPLIPSAVRVSGSALLQVEVLEASVTGFRLKTYYSERQSDPAAAGSSAPESNAASAADKVIEVSIASDGAASHIKGFDQLSPTQQFAWNDWLGRFTASMTHSKRSMHPGQKWESSEPETAPAPIANLVWETKSQYVRDERCPTPVALPDAKSKEISGAANSCAVLLVRSALRQKSSTKNPTPEDYKLRNLKTRGTASGNNETILYVALATGLLVRSSEDAQQSMDVFVALADGSNQVHYSLDAKSHSEILLLTDSPQIAH
jgi:hypothetical protein